MADVNLTDDKLAELLRVAEAATAGPWSIEECENECGVPYHHIFSDVTKVGTGEGVADTYHDNAFEMPSSVADAMEQHFKRPVSNRTTAPVQGKQANAAHIATFDPPTAAALVRECQRLRHDAYIETMEHRPVDVARADAAEEEVGRLKAELLALRRAAIAWGCGCLMSEDRFCAACTRRLHEMVPADLEGPSPESPA